MHEDFGTLSHLLPWSGSLPQSCLSTSEVVREVDDLCSGVPPVSALFWSMAMDLSVF